MYQTKSNRESLSGLIKKADDVFSKYIRNRDREIGASSFHLICFTCGRRIRIVEAHCMHFIDRDQMATRYDEMNAHGGCEECNCFDSEHHHTYYIKMMDKYGIKGINELTAKSRSLQKFMRYELEELIQTYKDKLKALN